MRCTYVALNVTTLFHCEQQLNIFKVCFVNQTSIGKISLTLGCFFGQDVAFKCMFTLDLSCSGQRKSFLCTRIRLHFWHFSLSNILKTISSFLVKKIQSSFCLRAEEVVQPFQILPGHWQNVIIILHPVP
jgi:hypothetical protein